MPRRPVTAALFLICLLFALLPTVSGNPNLQDLEQVAGTVDGEISIHLPAGWLFTSLPANTVYSSTLVFADTEQALEQAVQYMNTGFVLGQPEGVFGILTIVNRQFWGAYSLSAEDALPYLMQIALSSSEVHDETSVVLNGQYDTYVVDSTNLAINVRSYVGIFAANNDILLFSLAAAPDSAFELNRSLLEAIADTISLPAEPNALTEPQPTVAPPPVQTPEVVTSPEVVVTEEAVITPEATVATEEARPTEEVEATEVADAGELVQLNFANGGLSIVLPSRWFFRDRTTTDNDHLLIFGESDDATLGRLYTFRPDVFTRPAPMTGLGGVVVLYNAVELGLDPSAPDLNALMDQVLAGLEATGYEVVEAPAPIDVAGNPGIIAVVRGGEYGFLLLVAFDNQIAYITGTGTGEDFDANRDLLSEIIMSVRVPAATPTPTATTAQGLGGLGGLRVEATPTPPPGGLGGLGGLGRATPTQIPTTEAEATAESTVEG